ncbi:hypothetical protein CIPAW_11G169500 [Carya illinoinensis]|uniref:Uncharacterized protein n=1 Tax=Carya illinoinensis TaxID=32201 RepID=A0A8T1P8L2_CARIL|nr:hypothetical protein CIPAW_11G169500 [Carya illinoinensis]
MGDKTCGVLSKSESCTLTEGTSGISLVYNVALYMRRGTGGGQEVFKVDPIGRPVFLIILINSRILNKASITNLYVFLYLSKLILTGVVNGTAKTSVRLAPKKLSNNGYNI